MYKARNGFTLMNETTPQGWTIRNGDDLITALAAFPCFETVADGFILDALQQAVTDRKEYADIKELADYLAQNYI